MSANEGEETVHAQVAKVVDDFTVVINKGANHGVDPNARYLIYGLGEEVFDPSTGEALGKLEIVRGTARASHVQENISTLVSDRKRRSSSEGKRVIRRKNPFIAALGGEEVEERLGAEEPVPLEHVKNGDYVRQI